MIGLMMKGLGFDPAQLVAQANKLGETFAALVAGQSMAAGKLELVLANQRAIMAALGLMVVPSDAELRVIEGETQKYLARHNGSDPASGDISHGERP